MRTNTIHLAIARLTDPLLIFKVLAADKIDWTFSCGISLHTDKGEELLSAVKFGTLRIELDFSLYSNTFVHQESFAAFKLTYLLLSPTL